MNALLKLVAFSFFTLFANVSFAAWEELGSNDFMTVLIDKSSIKKSGDKVQVLSMLDLKKPGVEPKTKAPVNSIIGLNEYLCGQTQFRPLLVKFMAGTQHAERSSAGCKRREPFELECFRTKC